MARGGGHCRPTGPRRWSGRQGLGRGEVGELRCRARSLSIPDLDQCQRCISTTIHEVQYPTLVS